MLILGLFQVRYDFLTNDFMLVKLNTLLSLRFKRTEMDLVCPCVFADLWAFWAHASSRMVEFSFYVLFVTCCLCQVSLESSARYLPPMALSLVCDAVRHSHVSVTSYEPNEIKMQFSGKWCAARSAPSVNT